MSAIAVTVTGDTPAEVATRLRHLADALAPTGGPAAATCRAPGSARKKAGSFGCVTWTVACRRCDAKRGRAVLCLGLQTIPALQSDVVENLGPDDQAGNLVLEEDKRSIGIDIEPVCGHVSLMVSTRRPVDPRRAVYDAPSGHEQEPNQ